MSDARFAGVDWASEEHAVCVVDEQGRIVEGRRYRHNEPGIRALCARLLRLQVAVVALERPDGLLIERLLDAGLTVIAVHPNQVKAMRPRYSVAGGKSDSFDSFVLAELARTDSHRFRVLVPDSDRTKGGYRGSLTKTWFRPPRRLIARCDDAPASRGHRAAARLPGTQIMWPSWRRRSQLHRASRPEMT